MSPLSLLFITASFFAATLGTPVQNGQNVGSVTYVGKKPVVLGQKHFPYVVHITVRKQDTVTKCAGVIIGQRTVLTAARCVSQYSKTATIIVHAGIVDLMLEKNAGQKRQVENVLVHKGYREQCAVGKGRCCYDVNDLAILVLKKKFDFGPTVLTAKLSRPDEKPFGKQAYILGWGVDNKGKISSMLQKGQVRIAQQAVCEKFHPKVFVPGTVLCAEPIRTDTKSSLGDAGGPLVSNGVVYGITSYTITQSCSSETLDIFTSVGKYAKWINDNINPK